MATPAILLGCLALAAALPSAHAQDPPELRGVGSHAPPPPKALAVQGEVPEAWTQGRGTLIIFFSTLSKSTGFDTISFANLDERNTSIDVIAVASETPQQIQAMIQEQRSKRPSAAQLSPVLSDPEGRWRDAFLVPTDRKRLPVAIAIDQEGRIAWHGPALPEAAGYPMAMISANRWNIDDYIARVRLNVLRNKNTARIFEARRQARLDNDFQKVLDVYQEVHETDPKNVLNKLSRYEFMLADMNEPELAYSYGRELADAYADDYITLNDLAWGVVSHPDVQSRDLEFALEMSQRANALRGYADYALLDTHARIHWMRGDRDRAIEWQRRSVTLAPDSWHGDSSRENLSVYASGVTEPGTLPPPYTSPRKRR